MSGPDRIWVNTDDGEDGCYPVETERFGQGKFYRASEATEYIRRDPAVIAALPEVQALIAGVLELAARMIEDNVRHAKDLGREIWPIPDIRALIPADAIAARDAMIAAAIRKRGEGQP